MILTRIACLVSLSIGLASSAPAQVMTVTLLGTGDPTPRLDRFGPSSLVTSGEHRILIDAGRGTMQRLFQLNVSTADLDAVFLTHLHSDHVVGLVDLWLTGWVINRRSVPVRVFGPVGTAAMLEHLTAAFEFDIAIRSAEAGLDPRGIAFEVTEIDDGFTWTRGSLAVRAFAVDHRPVEPAFGFRIDDGQRSVAFSGDTRYSEEVIRHATGVDLLVHEVADGPDDVKARNPNLPRLRHHTQAEDVGRVFEATRPRLAVLSHLVLLGDFEAGQLVPLVRRRYRGPLEVGEDLMEIMISDTIVVRTASPAP